MNLTWFKNVVGRPGEGEEKKTPIFLTNLIDVMVSNVFLDVKFCMIVKSNEAQWKAMNEFLFLFLNHQIWTIWKKHYQYCKGQSYDCHGPKPMVACEWSLNIPRSQWCLTFDTLKVMTFTIILCTYFFFSHVSFSSHSNHYSALVNSFYPLLQHFQLVQELHCTKHIVIYNLLPHIASH